jgi:secondary thiamine-phosphate synthase enzyme
MFPAMHGDRLLAPNVYPVTPQPSLEITIRTRERLDFVDLTDELASRVEAAGIRNGIAHLQTCHTTTAVLLNENEPLLLGDLRRMLDRLVPEHAAYAHDDIHRRGCPPEEPRNGAAHCRAALLPSSQCVAIRHGRLALGRWQSLLLVELDGPRERQLRLTLMRA